MIKVLRSILGCLFIFIGLIGMFVDVFFAGICLMLFGISLLPIFYRKTKLNIKYIQIILPVVLFVIFAVVVSSTAGKTTQLHLNESVILMDVGEIKEVTLEIEPKKLKLENLEYCTSDNQIATVQKATDTGNEIILKIQSVAEGSCNVYVRSASGKESNRVLINVVDQERIEQEKKEKEESEAQAQKEAEAQAQREAEAQANNYSGSKRNTNNTHGEKVYRTPHGKRYHFDPDCGGKNSYQITMDAAKSAGLTPCQKCAQ